MEKAVREAERPLKGGFSWRERGFQGLQVSRAQKNGVESAESCFGGVLALDGYGVAVSADRGLCA